MKSADMQRARPNQARYAQLTAILHLRLAEIESALDRHEVDRQNWDHPDVLVGVDSILAEALVHIIRGSLRRAAPEAPLPSCPRPKPWRRG